MATACKSLSCIWYGRTAILSVGWRIRTSGLKCSIRQNSSISKKDNLILERVPMEKFLEQVKNIEDLKRQEQFGKALIEFRSRDKYLRGHMKFIKLAVSKMADFELQKDLLTYNRVLDLFPKGRFIPRNIFDAFWPKPHPQIDLALLILTKMEENGIRPDNLTYTILIEIFGRTSPPVEKCVRIGYWFDRFEGANPYSVKGELPSDPIELGALLLERICAGKATVDHVEIDGVPVMGAVFPSLSQLTCDTPSVSSRQDITLPGEVLHVEGPHRIWMKGTQQHYFTLSTFPLAEVTHGLLAVCHCQSADLKVLQSWIKRLQETYPLLQDKTVLFNVNLSHKTEDHLRITHFLSNS